MVRIIAGEQRGMHLVAVPGRETRPTADRVREALFSILGGRVQDARVLDLFCGTGALGLESLSRGAQTAVFVDRSLQAVAVARRNARTLGVEHRTSFLQMPAVSALRVLANRTERFDGVFVDPPYDTEQLEAVLSGAHFRSICRDHCWVVLEHRSSKVLSVGDAWRIVRQTRYGDSSLTILEARDDTRDLSRNV